MDVSSSSSSSSLKSNHRALLLVVLFILLFIICNSGTTLAQLDVCSVATTSIIPFYNVNISTNVYNDFYLFGNMCPFGYVRMTDSISGAFSCKPLDEFLLETVDTKSCVIPYGDPFYDPSQPWADETNCVLPYLACSPTTLKCTYVQTRMINDTCTDRMNCYGHVTNPFVNCHAGKCSYLQENPVLPEGSTCPFAPDSDFESLLDKALVNYTTNSYDNCDSSSYCHLPSVLAATKKCLRRVDVVLYESCGLANIEDEEGNPITVYKKCPAASTCNGVCLPSFSFPDYYNPNSKPIFGKCSDDLNPVPVEYSNTILICKNYTTSNCSIYTDCIGGLESSGISLKQNLDTGKWPGNQPVRCENSKCLRLFGNYNGESCVDNTDCYSSYCNTTSGTCTDLPSEITCGDTVDYDIFPCPKYSYCACSSEQRRVCIDFCMSKLMDLSICSMNYGMLSSIYYSHPLQPVQNKPIPIIDTKSSIFSPLNGKCSIPLNAYLSCMYEKQVNNGIDARAPSTIINNLSSQNTRHVAQQKRSVQEGTQTSRVDVNVGLYVSSYKNLFQSNTILRDFSKLVPLYDQTGSFDESTFEIGNVNLLNTTSMNEFINDNSDLYQIDGSTNIIKMSNQVVVFYYHNLVGIVPKFKTSNFTFQLLKTARICTCCDQAVRNLTIRASKSVVGITLKDGNREYQYIDTKTSTSDSLSITNYEPIMGHDSFLNRNWYSSCDLILVTPEEVDTMLLAIKNNIYFLDRNETLDPRSISELDNMKTSDYAQIFTTNIPTKLKTIPRSVRVATLKSEDTFNKVKAAVFKEIYSVFNESFSIVNLWTNGTINCSIFDTISVKDYHSYLFEIPRISTTFSEGYSSFQASSLSLPLTEFDHTMFRLFTNEHNRNISVSELVYQDIARPSCYSSYNQYLGVFHYNNPTKYWDLTYKDAMLFLVIILCLVFYIGLVVNYSIMIDNNKAMRRRLFVPFIAPMCIIFTCLFFLEPILMSVFKNVGMSLFALIPVPDYCISLLCSSYIVVTIRFFLLRNLYQLREFSPIKRENKSHTSRMKLYRIVSRPEISFMVSVTLSLVLAGIWYGVYYGILYGVVIQRFKRFEWSLQFDASLLSLASQFGFLSVVVMLVFVVDMILNIRTIKDKGFRHYFLFDDPFYLRIDIFTLAAMFVTCIVLILDLFIWNSLVVNRLCLVAFFLCSLLLVGGNVMIVDIATYIRKLRDTCVGDNQPLDDFERLEAQWEEYLTDINFRWLHRNYSNNEFSIENFNLYEDLEKVRQTGTLDLDYVTYLHATYFAPTSPYPINLPARCYTDFANAMTNLTLNPDGLLPYSVFKEIQYEVVKNNLDIFQRLILKDEFVKWRETFKFQKEMNVLSYTTSPSCE
ncbi:hypothetical protein NAEGRDRAFT_77883 [Naegleria gruberi]|uniref:RGS domain-containing protein n=1 Tax=Naegleria gruberi TaxID=5762 RepID=D2UZ31_NAEGR|nr:uncharacterized protein NAEGRDRAFT_77883 [Naegleria gruberi]EFC50081.1 hypothetical protein NAEGRDRAFT_77883 [Naegleria gruberi]|eukprot:XP_002682825.1 hypothetical protein NAEGRDRAFT_77883 [Naegleria gruberi strain NEG-M]